MGTGRRNREDDNIPEQNRLGTSRAKIRRSRPQQQGPHRLHPNERIAGTEHLQNSSHKRDNTNNRRKIRSRTHRRQRQLKQLPYPEEVEPKQIQNIKTAQNDAKQSQVSRNQETAEATCTQIRHPKPRPMPTSAEPTRRKHRTCISRMSYRNYGADTGTRKTTPRAERKEHLRKKRRRGAISKGHAHAKQQYNTENRKRPQRTKRTPGKETTGNKKGKPQEKPIVKVAQKYAIRKFT